MIGFETSFNDLIKNINEKLIIQTTFNHQSIKSLNIILKEKSLVDEQNYQSGIYIFEQALKEYKIDEIIKIQGILNDDEKQEIRKYYIQTQEKLSTFIKSKKVEKDDVKNLIKLITSDALISSISNYGLCYNFENIMNLIQSGDVKQAEMIATKDLFVIQTLKHFFKAEQISNDLKQEFDSKNFGLMDETLKAVVSNGLTNESYPTNLKLTAKNQNMAQITNVNSDLKEDLNKIKDVATNKKRETKYYF